MLAKLRRPTRVINKLPPQNRGTLSSDEVAIYNLVLIQWLGKSRRPLILSQETYPLDVLSETLSCQCIKGIDFASLAVVSRSVHTLTRDVLPRKNIRFLVEDTGAIYRSMSKEMPKSIPMSDPDHGSFHFRRLRSTKNIVELSLATVTGAAWSAAAAEHWYSRRLALNGNVRTLTAEAGCRDCGVYVLTLSARTVPT